uniref:Leucine rich repeat containing 73 n=1 Tax=Leptobrachium leishanense TaxID=445787 RepID=A0A8C5MY93_9ANUR
MLPGSIQMSGETLSGAEVKGVCEGLAEGTVRLLSLRGCLLSDRDFARLCQGVSQSPSLVQLNLNLGVVSSASRVQHLAQSLLANRSLHSLFLHGNPLTDTGLSLLNNALAVHPSLVSLDLGDCMLGDEGISLICGLLPPDGAKPGLRELTLSANTAVSCSGWARLAIALAHSSQIRTLNLDYNPLGDHIASMLAVCVASSRTLEVLDLEGTGLTNQSAQARRILHPVTRALQEAEIPYRWGFPLSLSVHFNNTWLSVRSPADIPDFLHRLGFPEMTIPTWELFDFQHVPTAGAMPQRLRRRRPTPSTEETNTDDPAGHGAELPHPTEISHTG